MPLLVMHHILTSRRVLDDQKCITTYIHLRTTDPLLVLMQDLYPKWGSTLELKFRDSIKEWVLLLEIDFIIDFLAV